MTDLSPETVGKLGYVTGDAVIVAHPHLYDEHVVAMVDAAPTKATVMIRYWDRRRGGWSDEPKRRKLDAIIGAISGSAKLTADRLESASAELTASRQRAVATYNRTIRALTAGDRS